MECNLYSDYTAIQIQFSLAAARTDSIEKYMDKKKPPESAKVSEVHFLIETEQEEDGRWIAEIAAIPGVLS